MTFIRSSSSTCGAFKAIFSWYFITQTQLNFQFSICIFTINICIETAANFSVIYALCVLMKNLQLFCFVDEKFSVWPPTVYSTIIDSSRIKRFNYLENRKPRIFAGVHQSSMCLMNFWFDFFSIFNVSAWNWDEVEIFFLIFRCFIWRKEFFA